MPLYILLQVAMETPHSEADCFALRMRSRANCSGRVFDLSVIV